MISMQIVPDHRRMAYESIIVRDLQKVDLHGMI